MLIFHNFWESVTHDGDQHVEHYYLSEECCEEEEEITEQSLRLVLIRVCKKLTQNLKVLIDEHVNKPKVKRLGHNFCCLIPVQV